MAFVRGAAGAAGTEQGVDKVVDLVIGAGSV